MQLDMLLVLIVLYNQLVKLNTLISIPKSLQVSVLLMGEMHQYSLAVTLAVKGSGIDKETFETLVHKAHQMCPYSKAISGNVDVAFEIDVD